MYGYALAALLPAAGAAVACACRVLPPPRNARTAERGVSARARRVLRRRLSESPQQRFKLLSTLRYTVKLLIVNFCVVQQFFSMFFSSKDPRNLETEHLQPFRRGVRFLTSVF